MMGLLFFAKPTQTIMDAMIIDTGIARNKEKTIHVRTPCSPANSMGANIAEKPQIRNDTKAASCNMIAMARRNGLIFPIIVLLVLLLFDCR